MEPARDPSRAAARAVLFDAYGTLFDVYSVACWPSSCSPATASGSAVLWRDKQIEYTRLASMSGHGEHYRPFWELTRAGLRFAALRLGLALDAAAEDRLMNQYRHLSAFPENQRGAAGAEGARHPGRHPEQRRPARCWRWPSRAPASTACSTR